MELTGKNVVLRTPEESDVKYFQLVRNNFELQHSLMSRPTRNSEDDVRAWFRRRADEKDSLFLIITDSNDRTACGFIQLVKIDRINKHAWLGICLDESKQGSSYADESMALLETYSRARFGLKKILLEVLGQNQRAIAFYIRNQYRIIGTCEQHHFMLDAYHDVVLMEKLLA